MDYSDNIQFTHRYNDIDKKHDVIATINTITIAIYPNLEKAKKLAPIKLKNILLGYASTEKYNKIKKAINNL